MQGFDPNDSLQIDQSIMQENEINFHSYGEAPLDRFSDHENDNMFKQSSIVSAN